MIRRAAILSLTLLLTVSMQTGMLPHSVRPCPASSALAPAMNGGERVAATSASSRDYGISPAATAAIDELKARHFEIVMPVFNKKDDLPQVIAKLKENGMIELCTFVEDVSTDGTDKLLRQYIASGDIRDEQVIFREKNGKKVGGINDYLKTKADKDAYIMVMDADSALVPEKSRHAAEAFVRLLDHCQSENLAAATVPVTISDKWSINPIVLLQKLQMSLSTFMRRVNQIFGQFPFLQGACTVWKTSALLEVYADKHHHMDFRTEDVDSTIIAKSQNLNAAFLHGFIAVATSPESGGGAYVKQQKRWIASIFINMTWWQQFVFTASFATSIGLPLIFAYLIHDNPLAYGLVSGSAILQLLFVMSKMDISKQLGVPQTGNQISIEYSLRGMEADFAILYTCA